MGYLLRLILLLVLGWVAYRLVKRIRSDDTQPPADEPQKRIEIIPCAKCGVHVPREEAIMHEGKAYCSTAHLEADKD
jgi:uncharacterized protein